MVQVWQTLVIVYANLSHSSRVAKFKFQCSASPRSPKCLWHALHRILMAADVHARYAWNFSYAPSQFLIARRHDEASPLLGHLDQTIICVASLTVAGDTLKPRVLRQPQGNLILGAQLLQLSHDTIGDARNAFSQQTVHHRANHIQLIPNRKVKEIRIDQDMIGWAFV